MTLSTRAACFAVTSVVACLAAVAALQSLFELSRASETASHVVLVPFVSMVLIYQNRETIFARLESDRGFGLVLLAAGAVMIATGQLVRPGADQGLRLAVAGVVTAWVAAFLLFFGRSAGRAALFPLLFLAFTIPFPQAAIDAAVYYLKSGSTEVVAALFALTGIPHLREGFVFTLPKFVIEIADECSGIRSSIALLMTSLLAGYVFLTSGWARALLVLAIFPVAILKNGIRITSLTLLASYVNPDFLVGRLHNDGGIVFFVMSLALLAPVLGLLRKSELRFAPVTAKDHS
jgi:exosortase